MTDIILNTDLKDTAACHSLYAAINEAKARLAAEEETHVRILVENGVYAESRTSCLETGDIGCPASSLTVAADTGAHPLFTSNVSVPGDAFVPVEGKPYFAYRMREDERLNDGLFPAFRDFYCNGRRIPLAESREERYLMFTIPNEKQRDAEENLTYKLYLDPAMLQGIETDCEPLTELWIDVEWQIHCVHIVGIDRDDVKDGQVAVMIDKNEWPLFVKAYCQSLLHRAYRLKNNLALLSENSFYYDRKNGIVYYYPEDPEVLRHAACAYPLLENILECKGIAHLSLHGLAFTGTTSNFVTENGYLTGQCGRIKKNDVGFLTHAAVHCESCSDVLIDGCRFYELGADALNFNMRTTDLTVKNSVFSRIGATAIRVGRALSAWNEETNANYRITIQNNRIDGTGLTYKSNVAVFLGVCMTARICHNTIKNSCYSAISAGWSWAIATWPLGENRNLYDIEIAYNYIDNFMFGMRDGGAIYTLGGNAWAEYKEYFNFIHHNYMIVGETCGDSAVGYRVIYHDNGSSHWHDYDNVILAREDLPPRDAFVIGGSRNDLIERTYILNYRNDTPASVWRPDGEEGFIGVIEKDTVRNLSTENPLPDAVKEIISAAGCDSDKAPLPEKEHYKKTVTVYLDAANGKDENDGTASFPVRSLSRALMLTERAAEAETDCLFTVRFAPGVYPVNEALSPFGNLPEEKHFSIVLAAATAGKAKIEARVPHALFFRNTRCLRFEKLVFTASGTTVKETPFCFVNGNRIDIVSCAFRNIAADAVSFTGKTDGVKISRTVFSDIGGSAIVCGSGAPFSPSNDNRNIKIENCTFTHIGYDFRNSPAVRADVAFNLNIYRNTFRDLACEAVTLGAGNAPVNYRGGKVHNIARTMILRNRIENYATAGNYAAVRVTGGNCTLYQAQPINAIAENYIRPGEKAGGDTGDYTVFLHGSGASHWHTRHNIVEIDHNHPSSSPLCRFLPTPYASYASWADENTVIADEKTTVFCDPAEIREACDLHDKATVFVAPDKVDAALCARIDKTGVDTDNP